MSSAREEGTSVNPLAYWIAFNRVRGIGPARLRALLDYFGTPEKAWHASSAAFREAGLDRRSIANLVQAQGEFGSRDRTRQGRESAPSRFLPGRMPGIRNVFYRSTIRPPCSMSEASCVPQMTGPSRSWEHGARSVYGREAARVLASDLARSEITIVSGLARGIDAQAHRAAIDAGGRTIAVLGSGVDVIYPWENAQLAQDIIEHGALLSEYALGTAPEAGNFPPRNRIISGLSRGVIVVEAGEQSGALITADFAAEQGRDVFAVPGSIFNRNSQGTNRLIRDGAAPGAFGGGCAGVPEYDRGPAAR